MGDVDDIIPVDISTEDLGIGKDKVTIHIRDPMFVLVSLAQNRQAIECGGFFYEPDTAISDDSGVVWSSMVGAARFRKLHDDVQSYPPTHLPGLRRVVLGAILMSDSGLVSRKRNARPLLIALANHGRPGRNSPAGKVSSVPVCV